MSDYEAVEAIWGQRAIELKAVLQKAVLAAPEEVPDLIEEIEHIEAEMGTLSRILDFIMRRSEAHA